MTSVTKPGALCALHYQIVVWALAGPPRTVNEISAQFQCVKSVARIYLGTLAYCGLGTLKIEAQAVGHRQQVFRPNKQISDREPDQASA